MKKFFFPKCQWLRFCIFPDGCYNSLDAGPNASAVRVGGTMPTAQRGLVA
jgi:hypothetical protein